MKISKFAFIFIIFAITTISNVSFGMNSLKDLSEVQLSYEKYNIEEFKQNIQEKNAEHILQNKLNQLKEEKEKEKEKNSSFYKFYLHKLYGEKKSLWDNLYTVSLVIGSAAVLYAISESNLPEEYRPYANGLLATGTILSGFTLHEVVNQHQTHIQINNEKIKNLKEILAEIEKNKFSN